MTQEEFNALEVGDTIVIPNGLPNAIVHSATLPNGDRIHCYYNESLHIYDNAYIASNWEKVSNRELFLTIKKGDVIDFKYSGWDDVLALSDAVEYGNMATFLGVARPGETPIIVYFENGDPRITITRAN